MTIPSGFCINMLTVLYSIVSDRTQTIDKALGTQLRRNRHKIQTQKTAKFPVPGLASFFFLGLCYKYGAKLTLGLL